MTQKFSRKSHRRLSVLAVSMLTIALLPAAPAGDAFSIVSMTLHDQALARAHDVELSGSIAFVPGKEHSLAVIDISDPEKPEILWFKSDEEILESETVLPFGDHLLLGSRDFLTLDVKNPANPTVLKTVSNRPEIDLINGMIKVGDYAITANKSGYVSVIDVSDPAHPAFAGAFETKKRFNLQKPHDIDRFGDYLVIVDPVGFAPPVGRVGIFKAIEDGQLLPADQWTLAGITEGEELIGANRVQVSGHNAFIGGSHSIQGRSEAKEIAGKSVTAKMTVVDLADPAAPRIIAHLPFPDDRGPNGLTIAGNVVFCAGGQTVAAYDISDPENPTTLAAQSFPRYKEDAPKTDNYHDLIYRDGFLYVSAQCDNGFLILRIIDQRIHTLAETSP